MLTSLYVRAANRIASLRNQKGATAVEYGIMVALIAAVIMVAVGVIGTTLNGVFEDVAVKVGGTIPTP